MESITTLTQKGQITIPVGMRRKMGAKPYAAMKLVYENGYVKVKPVKDIFDLAGRFKAPKGKNALKAREWMESHYERV